jgi:MinD-like ATPase involved in chromosome partitioning or flagellar assembly
MWTRSQIVTFYSYKGGVGRTFMLANVAVLLAGWRNRVLVVDWDLEAPGLHLYLRSSTPIMKGLIDLIEGYSEAAPLDWRRHLMTVDVGGATVDLLPAGATADLGRRVQALNWAELYRRGFGDALEAMREAWLSEYDIILIDSRTGMTDISGICTMQLPDVLVMQGTASDQSYDGLLRVAERVEHGRDQLTVDRARLMLLPILTRFDGQAENQLGHEWMRRFVDAFTPAIRPWLSDETSAEALFQTLRVPEIPFWNFGERLAVLSEGVSDPVSIGYPIEALAALLEHGLEDPQVLVEDRVRYIGESRRRREPFQHDLLLFVPDPGHGLVRQTAAILGSQGIRVAVAGPGQEQEAAFAQDVVLWMLDRGRPGWMNAMQKVVRLFHNRDRDGVIGLLRLDDGTPLPDRVESVHQVFVAPDADIGTIAARVLRLTGREANMHGAPGWRFRPEASVDILHATVRRLLSGRWRIGFDSDYLWMSLEPKLRSVDSAEPILLTRAQISNIAWATRQLWLTFSNDGTLATVCLTLEAATEALRLAKALKELWGVVYPPELEED